MTQSLGKWIPVAETNPTSLDAHHDPYVLHRQIRHKLHKAIDEENALNEQLYALQMRCQHGERLIIQEIQKAISDFTEQVLKDSNYYITVANEINGILPFHILELTVQRLRRECLLRKNGKLSVLENPLFYQKTITLATLPP